MVNINELAREINRTLANYANGVGDKIEKVAEKVAKQGALRLKANSPIRSGSYRRGWRAKKVGKSWFVFNATNYQLTHLLEKGHAKVGGGRVPAQIHIRPVEEEMIDEFVQGVEEAIRG